MIVLDSGENEPVGYYVVYQSRFDSTKEQVLGLRPYYAESYIGAMFQIEKHFPSKYSEVKAVIRASSYNKAYQELLKRDIYVY